MEIVKSGAIVGEIEVPADKSISHRAAMIASLCEEPTVIKNYLRAADCMSTLECLRKLGARIEDDGEIIRISGKLQDATGILDCGNSGTTLRLLMGLVAGQGLRATFTGDDSLKRRPLDRVINPLRSMGAIIEGDRLPVTIHHSHLKSITYYLPLPSAQIKSAILFPALSIGSKIVELIRSRDHSERMLKVFGASIRREGTEIIVKPSKLSTPGEIEIPGDISSAAYWIVLATIVRGSRLLIRNVGINPTRTGLIEVMEKMGARIRIVNDRLKCGEPVADMEVESADLRGIEIGGEQIPRLIDEIPILSVAAAYADGETIIRDAGELRVKESNRLTAIMELNKLRRGACEADGDTLRIRGGTAVTYGSCKTYGDHRIAMTLAIAGAAGLGVEIDDSDCVNISYPDFFKSLRGKR